MRPGKLRMRVGHGIAVIGAAMLVSGCVSVSTAPNATPTMSPTPVPVLGKLTLAHFPSNYNGEQALWLCEGWAGLRGQYVTEVKKDTPYQLDVWFSGSAWTPLFGIANSLENNRAYPRLTLAFGQATDPMFASVANGRSLDHSCAGTY